MCWFDKDRLDLSIQFLFECIVFSDKDEVWYLGHFEDRRVGDTDIQFLKCYSELDWYEGAFKVCEQLVVLRNNFIYCRIDFTSHVRLAESINFGTLLNN